MKKWTIYCHMHIDTNRCYVGITSRTMMHRWNQHVSQAKNSKNGRWHFPNAIRKYGKDAFSHRILETCDSLEKANLREDAWIELFETRNPQFGFNIDKGGQHKPHPIRNNPWDDPKYREKCTEAAKARWRNPKIRATNTAAIRAALNTPESKAKRTEVSKRVWSDQDRRNSISEKISKIANTVQGKAIRSAISKEAWRTGTSGNPEFLEKQRLAHLGKVPSPETCQKLSESLTGYKQTPEHIATRVLSYQTTIAQKTHKVCKKHGEIPIEQCKVRHFTNRPSERICPFCYKENSRRSARRHEQRKSEDRQRING